MKTILISPDKFKGSLTAKQVCEAVAAGIHKYDAQIECLFHPLADGGEGTLDALEDTLNLQSISLEVNDPLFRPVEAGYRLTTDTAFVEMSQASGLQLLAESERNCMDTTTFGTGELIHDAIKHGARQIYLFVGGSATNDAGLGMASALGYRFINKSGEDIKPIGREMSEVFSIDDTNLKVDLNKIEFTVVCDVKNPFYGPNGAAHAYGAQKGASPEDIDFLDQGLVNIHEVVLKKYDLDLSKIEGAGAAGGIAGGAVAFLGANVLSGIHSVMKITNYKSKLKLADFIITGEGKLDYQTVQGKVVDGVYDLARQYDKRVAIVCGIAEDREEIMSKIDAPVYQIKTPDISVNEAISNAYALLIDRSYQLMSDLLGEK